MGLPPPVPKQVLNAAKGTIPSLEPCPSGLLDCSGNAEKVRSQFLSLCHYTPLYPIV